LIAVGLKFQRCADPEILRPHQSVDSDHRSATARPQADAVSYPLSVRESAIRFLTTSPPAPATAVCPIHVSVVHRRNFAEYVGRAGTARIYKYKTDR